MNKVIVFALLLFSAQVFSQSRELVLLKPSESVIHHLGYELVYSEKHEQAKWIAYTLTKEETVSRFERTDRFIVDPKVTTGSASSADYKGSGFDRGHLAPAADMAWSELAMKESFYFSNMSPQNPTFNRGIWKKLEAQVRSWAIDYDSIYIVTGPVLQDGLKSMGENEVSIPKYYYKCALHYQGDKWDAIGFVIKNEGSKSVLSSFAVDIDSVESITGLDLYPFLEDSIENSIESEKCLECWNWKINKAQRIDSSAEREKKQCIGLTKANKRCKITTSNANSYCHVHEYQAPKARLTESVQCTGTTKSGKRCKRKTLNASTRCADHE